MRQLRMLLHLLVPMALTLLILAGCGRDKETPAPTAAAAPAAPETVATPTTSAEIPAEVTAAPAAVISDDPLTALTNAMAAQLGGGPYRAETSIDSGGEITEMSTEVIPPDKMHVVIGGGNLELILIDETLWSKSRDGVWTQMGSPDMMQSIFDSVQNQFDPNVLTNVQHVGAEPVFGEPTEVYAFTAALGEGETAMSSDVKVWISAATGLPVRMESTGESMGIPTHTVQSIDYDDSITIEAPTP